jgi:oxygen-independent coproporphyrinogen-3 oxidase
VYVHFPWCLKKCPYCDFLSIATPRSDVPHAAYADAVIREIDARLSGLESRPLVSVFFGGGTPSLWEPAQLGRVLQRILGVFGLRSSDVEVTAECNPSSLDAERARALVAAGVNRLSIGVQSLSNEGLRFLGRLHDAEQGLASVRAALEAGVPRVSADLIFGLPQQSREDAVEQALRVAELGIEHMSCYALTIEPGTQFGALHRKGLLPMAPEQAVAESFDAVAEALAGQGFQHYEISNYARAGRYAEHNLGYWRGRDYAGLGCGAWGTLRAGPRPLRYRNTPRVERYMELCVELAPGALAQGAPATFEHGPGLLMSELEELTPDVMLSEAILLGLRLREGVDIEAQAARLGTNPWTPERTRAVRRLVAKGQLVQRDGHLHIPHSAWLFADGIIAALL